MIDLVLDKNGKCLFSIENIPKEALPIVLKYDETFLESIVDTNRGVFHNFTDLAFDPAYCLKLDLEKAGYEVRFISLNNSVNERIERNKSKLDKS